MKLKRMKINYFFGAILSVPLLPILYFQGKQIRKKVPVLPEAVNPFGISNPEKKNNINIMCIGESTIAGVGAKFHKDAFAGSFAKELSDQLQKSVTWKVYAKSGYTVKKIATKIIPTITEVKNDLIIIGIGGNEAFTLNSPKNFKKEIQLLINLLKNKYPETPIAFTNMPPIKGFPAFTKSIKFVIGNLVEILGRTLQKIAKEHDNVFYNEEIITLEKWKKRNKLKGDVSLFFSDGVHPSTLTYQVWGKEMANFVLQKNVIK